MDLQIKPGDIVRSKAGRDKDRYFIVIRCEDVFAYVCDGDLRKTDKPKKKKIKHVNKTNTLLELDFDNISNSEIRKMLKKV